MTQSSQISDESFAKYSNQSGMASIEQINQARREQATSSQNGTPVSLPDMLVRCGIITSVQRETIERKLLAQQAGGIQQLDQYKLLKKIGEGGMGSVYLAEDTVGHRQVAVKVLPKKYSGNLEFLSRFGREAKSMAQLSHENIVTAFAVGEDLGYHYYVMEYCQGESLDALLKRELHIGVEYALKLILPVARGLQHAHQHGIVHRDIKPANIMIQSDGKVKILDLGLSKNVSEAEQSFNTQTGVILGTPHYISPEQAKGEKQIDGRSDIYSLGATLYHLLTGYTPFNGSSIAVILTKHLSEQLPDPRDIRPEIPDGVVHVIQRMMAKSPEDRYRECGELLADLERIGQGHAPLSAALDANLSSIAISTVKNSRTPLVKSIRKTNRYDSVAARSGSLREKRAQTSASPALYVGIGAIVAAVVLIFFLLAGHKPNVDVDPSGQAARGAKTGPPDTTRSTQPAELATEKNNPPKPDLPPIAMTSNPTEPAPRDEAEDEATKPQFLARIRILEERRRQEEQERLSTSKKNVDEKVVSLKKPEVRPTAKLSPALSAAASKEAEATAKLAEAQRAYDPIRETIYSAIAAREFAQAKQIADKASRDELFKPVSSKIDDDLANLKMIDDLLSQAEANAPSMIGEKIQYIGSSGRVIGFADGQIQLKIDGDGPLCSPSLRRDKKLSGADVLRFFNKKIEMPEETSARARVAYLIGIKEWEGARAAMNLLPPECKLRFEETLYLVQNGSMSADRVRTQKALEVDAEKWVQKVIALGQKEQFAEILAEWEKHEKRYHDTKAFVDKRAILESIYEKTYVSEMKMVLIPAGEFLFGPKHEKRTLPAFYIDKYEVSEQDYLLFLDLLVRDPKYVMDVRHPEGPTSTDAYWPCDFTRLPPNKSLDDAKAYTLKTARARENMPVRMVSWYAAYAYAKWAKKRLPTAEEWDKAARGTDGRNMPAGIWNPATDFAKYNGSSEQNFTDPYKGFAPIDSMEEGKSIYGCHHMSGNVWEWISKPGERRGGSCSSGQSHLSLDCCDSLTKSSPLSKLWDQGFRCARDVK